MNKDFQTQLTAWALDELPPEDRAAVEAALAEQPEARAYADDTRAFCALLQEAVGEEAELTAEQREELTRQLSAPPPAAQVPTFPSSRRPRLFLYGSLGAAAAVLAMWGGGWLDREKEYAAKTTREVGRDVLASSSLNGPAGTPEPETFPSAPQPSPVIEAPLAYYSPPAEEKPVERNFGRDQLALDSESTPPAVTLAAQKAVSRLEASEKVPAPKSDAVPGLELSAAPLSSVGLETRFGTDLSALNRDANESELGRAGFRRQWEVSNEGYEELPENPFTAVANEPLSTFSIDVDTAGYANVRRFLNQGTRPPRAAVRLEELVNYFDYDYPPPTDGQPFSVTVDIADCPWQPHHRLARIGLKGKEIAREARLAANLVFLIDVSGSMDQPNKMPLLKQSLHLLVDQLKGSDHVALVTYAGQSGVALPSTSCEQKEVIHAAIEAMAPGGSTNGASGIQLAYQTARQHFAKDGINRVLLATDGDFNVGLTDREGLQELITDQAKSGVFLSVLGFGMGNLKDATMEMLADKGNGNYAYIDSLSEARKVLGEQLNRTLVTIAKDVKLQLEFNPAVVRSYRLLGYENRRLAKEDFNDDKKDAGEIGAGHTVTALYELVPVSAPEPQPPVDALKYQPARPAAPEVTEPPATNSNETMTVKLRYKAPDGDVSQLIKVPVTDMGRKLTEGPADFQFAASVAMYGLLLKDSAHKGSADWETARKLALTGKGADPQGWRGEFIQLLEKARGLMAR